jgi:oxygen-dependent protoporphyrinogen oxidase
MAALVQALVDGYERTELRLGREVVRVASGYRVEFVSGDAIEADAVILATPAFVTAELLEDFDGDLAAAHAEVPYASSVVVSLAYSRADVIPLDGYGYLVPRREGSDVLACTWSSQKWDGRAPDEAVLVRVYAGRFGGVEMTALDDSELVAHARNELRVTGVEAEPLFTRVRRWPRGMPQYVLGHPALVERIERVVLEHPGLALAGAAYRGVGVPDCIRSGELAADSVAYALAGARA